MILLQCKSAYCIGFVNMQLGYLQVQDVQSSGSRAKAQAEADKAEERLAKYTARLEEVKNDGLPKVEVGTLEEVLTKMENDTDGTWDEIMFVPPGATTK